MENSIEEDIKILEELRIANENCIKNAKNKDNPFVAIWEKQNIALEHILSDYKRVLKENEELKEYIAIAPNLDEMTATKYRIIQQDGYIQGRAEEQQKAEQIIYENYIPIQKIKDIIARIDYDIKKTKEIISKNTNIYASYRKNDYQIVRLRAMNTKSLDIKKRLQELLDGSDTDVGSIESEE